MSSSSCCLSAAAARLVITISLYTADRISVEDILKRVKVQKEVVRCKKIAYKLQCPSFSYSTMHYAVVILLLQSPAFLWLSELSNCRTHNCGKHFESCKVGLLFDWTPFIFSCICCQNSHMATLRAHNQMFAIFRPLQCSALVGRAMLLLP